MSATKTRTLGEVRRDLRSVQRSLEQRVRDLHAEIEKLRGVVVVEGLEARLEDFESPLALLHLYVGDLDRLEAERPTRQVLMIPTPIPLEDVARVRRLLREAEAPTD